MKYNLNKNKKFQEIKINQQIILIIKMKIQRMRNLINILLI